MLRFSNLKNSRMLYDRLYLLSRMFLWDMVALLVLLLVDPLHQDPGTPIIRGQGAVKGLHLLEVIRGSSNIEDHTL